MVDPVFLRVLGVFGALFLLAALAILTARQMRGCIRLYAGQSFLLAVLAALVGFLTGSAHLYLVAALTLLVKTLLIPYLLGWVIHDTILEKREIEFVVNIPGSLFISGLLAALAFFAS
ncbi:MAG: hydrogenase, partial [Bacillota bacterium]